MDVGVCQERRRKKPPFTAGNTKKEIALDQSSNHDAVEGYLSEFMGSIIG